MGDRQPTVSLQALAFLIANKASLPPLPPPPPSLQVVLDMIHLQLTSSPSSSSNSSSLCREILRLASPDRVLLYLLPTRLVKNPPDHLLLLSSSCSEETARPLVQWRGVRQRQGRSFSGIPCTFRCGLSPRILLGAV